MKLLRYVPIVCGIAWLLFWILLQFNGQNEDLANKFTDTYSVVPLVGALFGLFAASKWGGTKSIFGKLLIGFSLGLILQGAGQVIYTAFYYLADKELAFPSVGDIAYMGSNLAYIYAAIMALRLLKPGGGFFHPLWVLILGTVSAIVVLIAMYVGFLHIGISDERGTLVSFLNVAYPVVQAVYFTLGIVALAQARLVNGSKMFGPLGVLLFALSLQFAADFMFLYSSYHETWSPGGVSDLLYLMAYIAMIIGIALIEGTRRSLTKEVES